MKNVRWQMLFQVVLVILIARVGVVNFLCHTQTMHTQITDHNELKPTKNRRSYTPKEQEHTNTHTPNCVSYSKQSAHQILYMSETNFRNDTATQVNTTMKELCDRARE